MDQSALHDFLRKNQHAWQLASKATDDYLLARLGLQNVLWSGFEMATQSIEKLLKSYLLFSDSALLGDAGKVRKAVGDEAKKRGRTTQRGHDVEAAYALAKQAGLPDDQAMQNRLVRINSHFASRYPDGGGPTSKATNELDEIDETVFDLWDSFASFNQDYVYTGGIAGPVYAAHMHHLNGIHTSHVFGQFAILIRENVAFAKRAERFAAEISHRLRR